MGTSSDISVYFDGEAIELDSRKPVNITNSVSNYWIENGIVDLFYVFTVEGKESQREYITSLDQHSIIFKLPSRENLKILMVGRQNTHVIPLKLPAKLQNVSDDLIAAIDHWLIQITSNLHHEDKKVAGLPLRPILSPGTKALHTEELVSVKKSLLWIESHRPLTYCSHYDLPMAQLNNLPLTSNTWVAVLEPGDYDFSTSEEKSTKGVLGRDLDAFHKKWLEILEMRHYDLLKREEELLEKSIALGEIHKNNAFRILANVTAEAEHKSREEAQVTGFHPLIEAMRHVAAAQHYQLIIPPDSDELPNSDLLNSLLSVNNLRSRSVTLSGYWWKQESGPLIGFLKEDSTPVALVPYKKSYRMYYGTNGNYEELSEEQALRIDDYALGIYIPFPEHPLGMKDLIRFSLPGLRNDIVMIVLMGVLGGVTSLLVPVFTGYIFDQVIPNAATTQLIQISLALVMAALAGVSFQAVRSFSLLRVEGKTDITLQTALWDRLLKLPVRFFKRYSTGELAMKVNGIDMIRQILAGTVVTVILTSIFNLFNLILLFWYAPRLAWIAIIMLIFAFLVLAGSVWYRVGYQQKVIHISQKLSGQVLQLLNGIARIKTTGTESTSLRNWAEEFAKQMMYKYRIQYSQYVANVFITIYPVITSAVIFYIVSTSPNLTKIGTGAFLAFTAAFGTLLTTLATLASTADQVVHAAAIYSISRPVFEEEQEVSVYKTEPGKLAGNIEVKGLHFSYTEGGPLILNDINLSIRRGEFVAFVGPSGSGKSTLMRQFLGFENPDFGSIYFDGQNMADLNISSLRKQFGVVLQHSELMAGSIFDNIVGSNSSCTLDDAWEAARKVGIADDIESMPMGMHTMISESGSNLSGGQKQLLMIARAIIHRPNILLMDEATSALDNHTQALVSASLNDLKATRLVVAHRLSTITHADHIVVIDKGKVVEQGTYEDLLEQAGLFAKLAERQMVS